MCFTVYLTAWQFSWGEWPSISLTSSVTNLSQEPSGGGGHSNSLKGSTRSHQFLWLLAIGEPHQQQLDKSAQNNKLHRVVGLILRNVLAVLGPGHKKALCALPPIPAASYWGFLPGTSWSESLGAWLQADLSDSSLGVWVKLPAQLGSGQTCWFTWAPSITTCQLKLTCLIKENQ